MIKFIEFKRNDKTYVAQYHVKNGILTVTAMYGSKQTQAGSNPEYTAKKILAELASEGIATDTL